MKRGSDEVDKGVGLAKEASASLDAIVSGSTNAMDMVQRIATATEEQSAATEEVTQNMEHISDITKRSATSTEQIKVSAADLAKLAMELKETTSWFKIDVPASQAAAAAAPTFRTTAVPSSVRSERPAAALAAPRFERGSNKLITWNNGLSVNVAEFDDPHKILINIINDMYDALKSGQGTEAVETILPRLVDYTVDHFSNEEALWRELNYPGYTDHKAKHEALKEQVLDYVARMKEGKGTAAVEFMDFLKNWLTTHIKGVDKKYGPHLTKKQAA